MTPHETTRPSLALSAAGLLDAAQERRVREHVRECAECAADLDALAALSAGLSSLPAPPVPVDLLARTQARLATELAAQTDRSRTAVWAVAACVFAWIVALATWRVYGILTGSAGVLAWLALTALPGWLAVPPAAALLAHRRRLERSMS